MFRHLSGRTTGELTSTIKGRTAETTREAYAAIQGISATRHKAINQAICQLAQRNVPGFKAELAAFEKDIGAQNLYTDAVIPFGDQEMSLEFHHLSSSHCKTASMAAYIMEKLRGYAIHFNIVPR